MHVTRLPSARQKLDRKLYTRAEFEDLRIEAAERMNADEDLLRDALSVKARAGRYYWVHQTNWLGEPCLQLAQDMFAMQEIIFRTRPRYIVELGVAWGGSLLFYSTLMQLLGGEAVVGVDVYMPDDLIERLSAFGDLSDRLALINASSLERETVSHVQQLVAGCRETMVIADSDHTHDHVLQELLLYSPLVGKGQYLVCADTVIEYQKEPGYAPRPWARGNNPKTALDAFLETTDRFEVDRSIDRKLLLTSMIGGYLKCVRD